MIPKQHFWKDTKNLFWGNEIMSNLKQSFTTTTRTKKWPSTPPQSTQPPPYCIVNIPKKTQEHMNSLPHAKSEFVVTTLRGLDNILTMLHWQTSESNSTLSNREKTELTGKFVMKDSSVATSLPPPPPTLFSIFTWSFFFITCISIGNSDIANIIVNNGLAMETKKNK